MRQKSKSPFQIGWESAKANVVPMIVLFCLMLAIVVGYYNVPVIAQGLNPLAAWQNELGWMAAFVNRSVFAFFCRVFSSCRGRDCGRNVRTRFFWGRCVGVEFAESETTVGWNSCLIPARRFCDF